VRLGSGLPNPLDFAATSWFSQEPEERLRPSFGPVAVSGFPDFENIASKRRTLAEPLTSDPPEEAAVVCEGDDESERPDMGLVEDLNPAHVPCWWMNNPTLGLCCEAMIGRADIEESKSNVAMNAWLPQASYPCGNFSDTSSSTVPTWSDWGLKDR